MKNLAFCLVLFSLVACKKEETPPDLCAGITCLNGGTCANGACNCPEQFTGSDCSQQKTPSTIEISAIAVTSFPPVDANQVSWDFNGGADLYIVLKKGASILYNSRETLFYPDANPAGSHVFYPPGSTSFDQPTFTYRLEAFDRDDNLTTDEFIGWVEFTPYSSTNGFPPVLFINCASCPVSFEIDVNYKF